MQLLKQAFLCLYLPALLREVFVFYDVQLLLLLCAKSSHCILHNILRDVLRGIEHTILFAL